MKQHCRKTIKIKKVKYKILQKLRNKKETRNTKTIIEFDVFI